jgi:pilus assembly protein Flp/PilA
MNIGYFAACLCRIGLDTSGATAIEYAMIASGVSIAIVTAVSSLGTSVTTNLYDKLAALF